MVGRLLGTAVGGAATLGFLYVGGGLATIKRIVKDAAKKTLTQYVMQNPTLAVATVRIRRLCIDFRPRSSLFTVPVDHWAYPHLSPSPPARIVHTHT